MKKETLKKYIGKTNGVLTAIELDHEDYDKEKQRKSSFRYRVLSYLCVQP